MEWVPPLRPFILGPPSLKVKHILCCFLTVDEDNCIGVACANGGRCIDDINSYRCECTQQWQGPQCKGM